MKRTRMMSPSALGALMAFGGSVLPVAAQEDPPTDLIYEEVLVTGGRDNIRTLTGSATLIDEEQIQAFDTVDINNLLRQVPGVYLRIEDGYGLRPNIGLRGATSERSQKITLMEDGILIAPAPYSAPAAYYMPNINRMSALEVFKGPSAVRHGPHTVGGALNMATPGVPDVGTGRLEATLGTDNYQKYRAFYGASVGQFGYWVDGLHYSSDGFKDLDSGGDTGFERNDVNVKLQWRSDDSASIQQQLQIKLGYAEEDSQETYLGLTDDDFDNKPERRYVSSELDRFDSQHTQIHLLHAADFGNDWQLNTRLYHNEYSRDWFKFDGFIDGRAPASTILANPELFPREMALLRGEADSDGSEREMLDVTDFIRDYGSTGVEFRLKKQLGLGSTRHSLEGGLRYHEDYVERKQDQQGFLMLDSRLVSDGEMRPLTLSNEQDTEALALFLADRIEFGRWTFDLGLRYEGIEGEALNRLNGISNDNSQDVWIPGAGVLFELTDNWSLLLGVNRGFSPAGAGAADSVDPEKSVNYEYGARYNNGDLSAELIGFFSDYSNLLGRCRVSDPSCEVGEEFNGGEVEIAGAEVTANYTLSFANGMWMPFSLVYTYTETAFQTSFQSNFSQWNPGHFQGIQLPVREGDELPYTPEHQLRLQAGLSGLNWDINLALRYISEMREVPGRGDFVEGESTEAYTVVDFSASYTFMDKLTLRAIVENVGDEVVIVSRRPFGARPNLPRQFRVGLSYSL